MCLLQNKERKKTLSVQTTNSSETKDHKGDFVIVFSSPPWHSKWTESKQIGQ